MQDPASELRRIPLPRTRVHKYHHGRLSLLVNEEHTLIKPVRYGLEAGLSVQIVVFPLCAVLVGGGKLAGREHLPSPACHHDIHAEPIGAICTADGPHLTMRQKLLPRGHKKGKNRG
jgi:hypothetical protein